MNHINFNSINVLNSEENEAYNSLRTNLLFSKEGIKVISFTSYQPNEGKSTVAFQLSVAMTKTNKRVLLIDADIRKSVLSSRYGVDRRVKGLSEYLSGQGALDDCLCSTNIDNMDIILAGHNAPNPTELLSCIKFNNLIKELNKNYDYIFIDCPPIGCVIDAIVVSKTTDGVIMIMESETISRKIALDVKKQLERSGSHILGIVLNKVKERKKGYYNYYGARD